MTPGSVRDAICVYDYTTEDRNKVTCLAHRDHAVILLDGVHRFSVLRDLAANRMLRGVAAEEWARLSAEVARA